MPATNTRELTKEQIDHLFEFTYRKRVRYYDVQIEIVDHLASAIEEKWRKEPDLPFETALEQVYQSFGIFGFARMVQARERAIARLGRRELAGFLGGLLQPRQIWKPALLFFALYTLFARIDLEVFFQRLPLLAVATLLLIAGLIVYFLIARYHRSDGKKFLLNELPVSLVAAAGGGFHGLFLFIPQLMTELAPDRIWLVLGLSLFYSLWLILLYAGFFYLPARARELIREMGH